MKKSELLINGEIFIYEDEIDDITYDNISSISEEDGKEILLKAKELFSQIGLEFYLAFGTLLGAIREHNIIPGDEDVDIMIFDEETLYNNLPFLYKNNFKLCRIEKGILYSFRLNKKAYIDVYIIKEMNYSIWKPYCYSLAGYVTPKKYLNKFTDIDFLKDKFLCPQDPEKIIKFWYGKNWCTPQSGKNYYYEVKTAHYWKRYFPILKKLIKLLIGYKYWK